MIPDTERAHRARVLASTGRDRFETGEDYYTFQHLNDRVQLFHSISFLVAVVVFVASIVKLSLALFVLQYLISTGGSVAGHWVFDGWVPSGPVKTPGRALLRDPKERGLSAGAKA